MDVQQYIASGVLERYIAGLTAPQETEELERLMGIYPEIGAKLEEIHDLLEKMAKANAKSPKTDLKDKIMKNIEQLKKKEGEGEGEE